jgi:hypothetical protein
MPKNLLLSLLAVPILSLTSVTDARSDDCAVSHSECKPGGGCVGDWIWTWTDCCELEAIDCDTYEFRNCQRLNEVPTPQCCNCSC